MAEASRKSRMPLGEEESNVRRCACLGLGLGLGFGLGLGSGFGLGLGLGLGLEREGVRLEGVLSSGEGVITSGTTTRLVVH